MKLVHYVVVAGAVAFASASGAQTVETAAPPQSQEDSLGLKAAASHAALLAVPEAPSTVVAEAVEPLPQDLTEYKKHLAERIAELNDGAIKKESPRPADAQIVGLTVLGLHIRADGSAERVWVVRSSGKTQLDDAAIASVNRALPLPAPTEASMVGRGFTILAESWLHRTDGKFQLISKTLSSLAQVTQPVRTARAKSAVH